MRRCLSFLLVLCALFACLSSSHVFAEETPKLSISVAAQTDKFLITISDSGTGCNFYSVMVGEINDGCITEAISGEYVYETQSYSPGQTYEIEVIASGNDQSAVAKESYYFALPKPEVSMTQKGNGYKLQFWSAMADGYLIYLKKSDADEYALYKSTKKTSLTIKSDTADSYKIKAYKNVNGKKIYSEFSKKVVGVKYVEGKVSAESATSKYDGKLTVKWKKFSTDYDGWQIQYTSYDNFSYHNTVNVKNKNATSKTIPVIGGITYKVRVRGYRKVSGSKAYARWGSAKTVVVKSSVSSSPNATKLLNSIQLSPQKTSCVKLNKIVAKILKKYTKPDMTVAQKVRAVYLYISHEKFSDYGISGSRSYSSLMELNALTLLETKSGSCVNYNSLFTVLCHRIGIKDAYLAKGSVPQSGGGRTAHTWCMIKIGNHNYIFDPRMQKYTSNRSGYDYYCVPLSEKSKRAQEFRFFNAKEQLI